MRKHITSCVKIFSHPQNVSSPPFSRLQNDTKRALLANQATLAPWMTVYVVKRNVIIRPFIVNTTYKNIVSFLKKTDNMPINIIQTHQTKPSPEEKPLYFPSRESLLFSP